jgi:hypothetical protein
MESLAGVVTVVIDELRAQIETAQRGLVLAEQAGLPHEAHLQRARVQDLLEMAARHGIDVSGWAVDRSLLPAATRPRA